MPSASVHTAAHLSWRLRAGTAGRRAARTAAGPFLARWQSLLGHRSFPGRRRLPFLPSLQSLRGREEGRALRHAVPVASSSSVPHHQSLWHRSLFVPKCWCVQLCHWLCHHPAAKATSDTLWSRSPPPRGGTCSLSRKDAGSFQTSQNQTKT